MKDHLFSTIQKMTWTLWQIGNTREMRYAMSPPLWRAHILNIKHYFTKKEYIYCYAIKMSILHIKKFIQNTFWNFILPAKCFSLLSRSLTVQSILNSNCGTVIHKFYLTVVKFVRRMLNKMQFKWEKYNMM